MRYLIVLIAFVLLPNLLFAQEGVMNNKYGGFCSIERVNKITGQKQVFNLVFVKAEVNYHELDNSWETVLTYKCNEGTCKEAIYIRYDKNVDKFVGLEDGSINCAGSYLTLNTSNKTLFGILVNSEPTYTITFKNLVLSPNYSQD